MHQTLRVDLTLARILQEDNIIQSWNDLEAQRATALVCGSWVCVMTPRFSLYVYTVAAAHGMYSCDTLVTCLTGSCRAPRLG